MSEQARDGYENSQEPSPKPRKLRMLEPCRMGYDCVWARKAGDRTITCLMVRCMFLSGPREDEG